VVCSRNTVDCYNPKVVQATMGSLARVNVEYVDLESYITDVKAECLGTFMTGENVYTAKLPSQGIIVMGNEANGISKQIEAKINRNITIPQFGDRNTTESLNVATATAIFLSEFRRRSIER